MRRLNVGTQLAMDHSVRVFGAGEVNAGWGVTPPRPRGDLSQDEQCVRIMLAGCEMVVGLEHKTGVSMLTLPDGTRLSVNEVIAALDAYRRENPAVFDLYDLPAGGPHDKVVPLDLLSLNAINAFGPCPPMTAMTEAWRRRDDIATVARRVTKDPLEQLPGALLDAVSETVGAGIELVDDIPDFGYTSSAKLFHRLRPNVGPIWDKRIAEWYGESGGWAPWVRRVYGHVLEPETLQCLQTGRKHLGLPLSLLRIWDVLLWQLGA